MDAVKTLLIDHHDSYSYNLFQLLTEVNGEEPVVVLHDAPECLDLLDPSGPPGHRPRRPGPGGARSRAAPRTSLPDPAR
jgi:para-aminobenzoate synthetase